MGALNLQMKVGLVIPVMEGYLPKNSGKVNTCHNLNLPTMGLSGLCVSLKDFSQAFLGEKCVSISAYKPIYSHRRSESEMTSVLPLGSMYSYRKVGG